jgi:hypothetical protein
MKMTFRTSALIQVNKLLVILCPSEVTYTLHMDYKKGLSPEMQGI